jgi:hypothetical protein
MHVCVDICLCASIFRPILAHVLGISACRPFRVVSLLVRESVVYWCSVPQPLLSSGYTAGAA